MRMILIGLILSTGIAGAQTTSTAAKNSPIRAGAYDSFGAAGLVCGLGASASSVATKPTVQCGGVFQFPLFELEAGVMGPEANQSNVSGYLSTNLWVPLRSLGNGKKTRGVPILTGGYTRMFETGHAVDYGLAYARPVDSVHSIQFELRDYGRSQTPVSIMCFFAWSGWWVCPTERELACQG